MRAKEFFKEDIKSRVIRSLTKLPDESPIFPQVYKVLVGEPLSGRIKNYIQMRKDLDAIAQIEYLDKTIPTLGSPEEIKTWISKFKDHSFDPINVSELCPPEGMTGAKPVTGITKDPITLKLFEKILADRIQGKGDAGPGEAPLAILSPNITYAPKNKENPEDSGGDIFVTGVGRVEVKGGTGGRLGTGPINQTEMAKTLAEYEMTKKSISVLALCKPIPSNFPIKEFLEAASIAWFGQVISDVISAAGTPAFKEIWTYHAFESYKKDAKFKGILFINSTSYQYVVHSNQIPFEYFKGWGSVYYPGGKQGKRDMAAQISPR
jgi:hypothetical protein